MKDAVRPPVNPVLSPTKAELLEYDQQIVESYFQDAFWSTDYVLPWIKFRHPLWALKWSARGVVHNLGSLDQSSPIPLVDYPKGPLLKALQSGRILAIDWSGTLSPEAWAFRDRQQLGEVMFKRDDVLRVWPPRTSIGYDGDEDPALPEAEPANPRVKLTKQQTLIDDARGVAYPNGVPAGTANKYRNYAIYVAMVTNAKSVGSPIPSCPVQRTFERYFNLLP